jgi:hypothetical protein
MNDLNELNNLNDNEIIYEENTEVDSEEIEDELMEDPVSTDTVNTDKPPLGFDFSQYCNMKSLLVLGAFLVVLYLVFKDKIHEFLEKMMNSNSNLCSR